MNLLDKESLFQPGKPVDPNNFKGRVEKISDISRYLKQVSHGSHQHLFLTGKRGMGKSSFARYMGEIAMKECNMIYVHLYLDGVDKINDLLKEIIAKIISETEENWKDKISSLFGDTVKTIGFGGLKVEFAPSEDETKILVREFPRILNNILEKAVYGGKKGLF
ncbi:MAG: ATP-binding protein [Methanobrevibacter sp.]|nr:ATP-binding protein [Methanobrevibacter sp.]